ncbi:MAG: glycosyltransferase family 2 protein [Muribaculaceae bacterium]|nr:glycosyltransferase family 2 protein [Muribaculaceae bacterium]
MMNESENSKECMTVVVPVYNRAHLIRRCLDSIYAQTYRPVSVIVVDNASSDSTSDEVVDWAHGHAEDGFSIRLINEDRRGASYARQTGLEHTVTDKVMFFDSDDKMLPDAIRSIVDAWSTEPEADAVAWPLVVHGKDGDRLTHSVTGCLLERHMVHAIFCTLGYAVRKDVLMACGGWCGKFTCWDDLETGVRLLLRDPRVIALKKPMAEVFPQAESISGLSFYEKTGKWELALDGIDDTVAGCGRRDTARLHNIVSYRRAILAADYFKEGHTELAWPLYRQALSEVPKAKRPLIRFAYHWTRLGMRGAFSIVGRFL